MPTDFAGRQLGEILVQNADFGAACRLARGVGRGPQVWRSRGGDHAGLGGVVVVVDDVAELIHEAGHDVGAHA